MDNATKIITDILQMQRFVIQTSYLRFSITQ